MVTTVKFSNFVQGANNDASLQTVGLSGGVNSRQPRFINWTTATRPVSPYNGLLGYNTDISEYEFWDGLVWTSIGGGGGSGVTSIGTGTGLTGGTITSTGTISFASILQNSFWANTTGVPAVPTVTPLSILLLAANNLSDVPNKATARSNLGLAIGTNVEAWSAALDSIAALTTSANELIYTTASNTYSTLSAMANAILVTNGGSVPSFSQTLPNIVQTNITRLGAQAIALDMNSHQINNVTDPTNPQDAATMAYVTAQTTGTFLPLIGGTMAGVINMGNHQITHMSDPSSAQDAVTLNYLNTTLGNYLPLSGGTMTGAINMGSSKITNLLDPTNPQDAATKNYVDTVAIGFNVKAACQAVSTSNLNATYLNGASGIGATLTNAGALTALVIDGYTVNTNDRLLIQGQTSTLQNGIYVATNVGSGAVAWILTRATDFDQPAEIQPGDLVIINHGTVNAGTSWLETATVTAIGTDPILFSQFTFSATQVLLKANNLNDVANTTTSFNNISPTTTKGDIIVNNGGSNIRLGVGANSTLVQANSATPSGLQYTTATYPTTTTANQLLYSSSTNTITGLSSTVGGVLVTDVSQIPQFLANPSASGRILQSVNGAIPAWSTPTYPSTSGTSEKFLISDGTNNVYSTSTIPTSAGATAGKILVSDGTNYVLSTPTFPNASATSRKIIVSDGTNWIASTETYATPGTSGNVMTSDGTNWTSAPATGVSLLTTKGDIFGFSTVNARVPVATGNGKVLQVDSSATVGVSYSTPTYPSASGTAGKLLRSDGTNNLYSTSTYPDTNAINTIMYASSANVLGVITPVNSAVLISSSGGVPSMSTTIPQGVQQVGTTAAGNATAGNIGEVISNTVNSGTVTLTTTATSYDITSISLTAGDWDVWGNVTVTYTGTGGATYAWISTTSATLPNAALYNASPIAAGQSGIIGLSAPYVRINVAGNTTVYLSVRGFFSTGAASGGGGIFARRAR